MKRFIALLSCYEAKERLMQTYNLSPSIMLELVLMIMREHNGNQY